MDQPFYKRPQVWLGIGISVLCLIAVFSLVDLNEVGEEIRSADYRWMVVAFAAQVVYLAFRAVRWRYMLENKVGFWRLFHIQNIGNMLNQLAPLRMGDASRAVLVGSEPNISIGQGLSTMVVERLLDMLAVVTLLPFTLSQIPSLPEQVQNGVLISRVLGIAGIVIVIAAANMRPIIARLLTQIFNRIPALDTKTWVGNIDQLLAGLVTLTHWRRGLILGVLSILPWVAVIFSYQFAMYAMGLTPNYLQAAFVVCVTALSIAAPSSPGQVGIFEAAAILAVTLLFGEEAKAMGTSFAFVYHLLGILLTVLLGLVGLWQVQSSFGKVLREAQRYLGRSKK